MKPHFDPELDAPVPLDDEALQADEPITPSVRPAKRPLWDQPKVQIAALAVFAVLGLTWKMSGSSTPPTAQPQFTAMEPVSTPAPVTVDSPVRAESLPAQQPDVPVTEDIPPAAAPHSETDSLAGEVSRALNSQQVYSEKTREGLAALARRVGNLEQQITELKKQRHETPVAVRQPTVATTASPAPKSSRASSSRAWSGNGAKVNSLYPGLAWVTWQGSSWALRPGDRFAGATVLRIDESKREVVTSSGVIR
ncbi:conjugal transfer protein TraP [Salmonella enterica]|nr:conjugal transfer protein TraP [Salmonella enterica]